MIKGNFEYDHNVLIIHTQKTSEGGVYIVYDPDQEKPWIVHTWSEGMKPQREADFFNLAQAITLAEKFT